MLPPTRINTAGSTLPCIACIVLVTVAFCTRARTAVAAAPGVFDVRDYGATGDGKTLDTQAVNRAAAWVESWTETPVGRVVFRDVDVEFTGGAKLKQGKMPAGKPGVDARPLPAWGIYARNVDGLQLEDVRLGSAKDDLRHAIVCDGVKRLTLDDVHFPRAAGAADPLVLEGVGHLDARGEGAPAARQR